MSDKFQHSFLKSTTIDLKHLEKLFLPTEDDVEHQYNPFLIDHLQNYIPTYNHLFNMSEKNYNLITLNNRFHFSDLNTAYDSHLQTFVREPIFIKYSPLVDPIRYIMGKYNVYNNIKTLPSLTNQSECFAKLTNTNNVSYVDGFFCFLSNILLEKHGFANGIKYYDSYLGVQQKFKSNITDDIEFLQSSKYFMNNIGNGFTITKVPQNTYTNFGSRSNKQKINLSSTHRNITFDNIDMSLHEPDPNTDPKPESDVVDGVEDMDVNIEQIYENGKNENSGSQCHSNTSSSCNSLVSYSSDEDDENDTQWATDSEEDEGSDENSDEEDEGEEEEEEEEQIYAYIKDFPMQMICIEKCDGTIDKLFVQKKVNKEIATSALFQIVMILIAYQKAFHFTHNDLHTNNIVYVTTEVEYLYYKFENKVYRVPTYGYIYKIIDFGRSIYSYNGLQYCSDSYSEEGDANSQYNFEPYYNKTKPLILPNYSFDLCRLGTSIYDFIIDEDTEESEMDEVQQLICCWVKDDNGKNVLYKKRRGTLSQFQIIQDDCTHSSQSYTKGSNETHHF